MGGGRPRFRPKRRRPVLAGRPWHLEIQSIAQAGREWRWTGTDARSPGLPKQRAEADLGAQRNDGRGERVKGPAQTERYEIEFEATPGKGQVRAIVMRPPGARTGLVFAHGAGAGMRHGFMESLSARLSARGVATFRYEFAYMAAGGRRPDAQPVLLATIRSAVARAIEALSELPLFAGGKSMGGRMTSLAAAASPLDDIRGIVFFGFPLHAPGRPGTDRAAHLEDVRVPMLFLQGPRDTLAELHLLEPVIEGLGERATLLIEDGADHGFHVLKRSGRSDADVLDSLADRAASWFDEIVTRSKRSGP
jgi:uncharacterized protein